MKTTHRAARPARLFHGWVIVWAVHVVLFTIFSAAYAFSSFFTALEAEFAASRAGVSFAFGLAVFLYFLVGAFAGVVADRTHVRNVVSAGIVTLAGGLYLSSHAHSLMAFYVCFGLAIGIGVGCAYVPSIAAVQPWFVRRRATAAGIASSGIGLATLVTPLLAVKCIEALGWRATLQWLALAVLVLGLAAALQLEKSPQARGLHADGDAQSPHGNLATGGMGWVEAVRSRTFVLFFLTMLGTGIIQFMPFVHLARHALDRGFAAETGALLLGLIGLGSFVGRLVMTRLADRHGRREAYAAMFGLMALSFAWWLISLALPASFPALSLFAILFGLGYGGFVGIAPPLAMGYFGGRSLSGLIGLLYLGAGTGTLFAPTFAGWAYDTTGSYALPLVTGVACNLVALALALRMPRA